LTTAFLREAWAEIDLEAIAANVAGLAAAARPARLCAVVKADAYGHGAVPVARAARAGGADWLAVALVEEGVELRQAGIEGPVLVLSEPPASAWDAVVAAGLTPTVYSLRAVAELVAALGRAGASPGAFAVHVKLDTGMHRVGAGPAELVPVVEAVVREPLLGFQGLWTHLAVAEEPGGFTGVQLARLNEACVLLAERGLQPEMVHAANSAGHLLHPESRLDLVRCGIAVYGYPPSRGADGGVTLRPALSLRARVSHVRALASGERISYGQRYRLKEDSVVATVPLGYADGVPRGLAAAGGQVLIGGRRRPMAGTVTMDQLMVDCGPDGSVGRGEEVVLLGRQGGQEITAADWADLMGTISYEILCGIGPRVRRQYRETA
jgi:alanine racemase